MELIAQPVLYFIDDDSKWSGIFCGYFWKVSPDWKIIHWKNAFSALTDFACFPEPQAILMEIHLAGLNGLELIEWIRQEPRLESCPLFVLTRESDPLVRLRCAMLGVNGYMEKTGSRRHLRRMLTKILGDDERISAQADEAAHYLNN